MSPVSRRAREHFRHDICPQRKEGIPAHADRPPEDNAATGDLDIKCNLFMYTTNGRGALVSASGLGDRVFHIIQPPSGPINVTFVAI
jgi:hypothetical protein